MKLENLIRSKWDRGQLLAFSALDGPTDYEEGLVARTVAEPDGIEIRSPEQCLLLFGDPPAHDICFGGDFFEFRGAKESTRGMIADAHHLLIEGPCTVPKGLQKLRYIENNGRLLIGIESKFDPKLLNASFDDRRRWILEQSCSERGSPQQRRTTARALTMMKSQVYSPEGLLRSRWTTPDRWPHKDMWLWDTAFHAIGWRHVDSSLAMEMIDALFDLQREDGFLTYRGTPAGPYFHLGELVTQPPVLAHAVQLVFEKSNAATWLEKLYPKLAAYIEWDLRNRDTDGGGLMEWFIEDDEKCRSGESGMDNSPRFDDARRLDAVDFNSFLARECEVLGQIAEKIGRPKEASRWRDRHHELCRLINERFWSEEEGFYFDYDPATGQRSRVWASAGFFPLLCGAASHEQASRLAIHLRDPELFATRVPIPSVAVCDKRNYSKDMWRGPTWANVNWLIAEGLERNEMSEDAQRIREATIKEIERSCEKFGTFFEYFDDRGEVEPPDLLRKGTCAPDLNPYRQVIHEFGWTATLYVDLVFR